MGTDDLFKKRKAQKAADLERQRRERIKGPRYLIVTEGEKTEPYYFDDFCADHGLRTPRVRVTPGALGSAPENVVTYAEQLFEEDAQLGPDRFDQVFCVVDRDTHAGFKPAMERIAALAAEGKPFVAIPSIPCFEYWLLLHFSYTRQPFYAKGKASCCDTVIRALRKQPGFSDYEKAKKGVFGLLKSRIVTAIEHAERAANDATATGETNPSTQVNILVRHLQKLAANHGRKR